MRRSISVWGIELKPHMFLRGIEEGKAVWGTIETSMLFRTEELAREMIASLRIEKAKPIYLAIAE